MQWINLFTVAALGVVGYVQGADDCMPKPGEKFAGECCKVKDMVPESFKSSIQKCAQKYPHPPRPSGPPPTGAMPAPDPAMKKHMTCMAECAFTENNLLTADKKLDKAAFTKLFTPTNKDFAPVVTAAIEKCIGSYQTDIDQSLECKSGAAEFKKCLMREEFLNCPSSMWDTSSDCTELKTKVTKCPQMPIMMGDGPHPH